MARPDLVHDGIVAELKVEKTTTITEDNAGEPTPGLEPGTLHYE